MLNAKRFTTVVTRDTYARLLRADDNSPAIAKGETHRGAVVALQTALADLNASYLLKAEIDGFFGPRTARAVEAFQRDYGLVADGIAGHQVLAQLDQLFSPDVIRNPSGMSVHVGVDKLSDHYGGAAPELFSCVNDAREMQSLADALGYDSVLYANEDATTSSFVSFMRTATETLVGGDSLMVTFSGHGSQVANTSDDPEEDLLDETLCFYDRMLIDDEFYALLGELREGVRVHVVLDSCHSGTAVKVFDFDEVDAAEVETGKYVTAVTKALKEAAPFAGVLAARPDVDPVTGQDIEPLGGVEPLTDKDLLPIDTKGSALQDAIDGAEPEVVEPAGANAEEAETDADILAELFEGASFGKAKFLDAPVLEGDRKALYEAAKSGVIAKEDVQLGCVVTLLAACDDAQTTPAGNPLSYFTANLTAVWQNGGFPGSYTDLYRAVKARSRYDVTPQMGAYGPNGSEARQRERPFVF
jgi:metacaspase-1